MPEPATEPSTPLCVPKTGMQQFSVSAQSQTGPPSSQPPLRLDTPPAVGLVPADSDSDSTSHDPDDEQARESITTTSLHRPNAFNVYGSDLSVADALEDEEVLDDAEVLEEFAHGCDEDDDEATSTGSKETTTMTGGGGVLPSTASSGRARATMPTWLASEYQRLRERLTEEMKKSRAGLPQCYQRNTFYDGVENQYLAARSTFQLSASLFHQPRFFVWFPHVLVDKIPCPACRDTGRQSSKSSCVYLQKRGFVDYPRRVVDVDRNVYVVGYRYTCGHKDCGRTYLSWSPAILDILPPPLRDQFEFRLTHRSGLTSRVVSLLREAFNAGIGPQQFTTMIEAAHYHRYDLLQCQFLEMVLHRSGSGTLSSLWTTTAPFGAFGDRNGYAGYIPSARYFANFYDILVEESAPAMRQLIASLPADIIKQDHSFKVFLHGHR